MTLESGSSAAALFNRAKLSALYRAPEPVFLAVLRPNNHIAPAKSSTGRINLQ